MQLVGRIGGFLPRMLRTLRPSTQDRKAKRRLRESGKQLLAHSAPARKGGRKSVGVLDRKVQHSRSLIDVILTLAKVGTLKEILNICLKLSLIASFLYGTVCVHQLKATIAPLPKMLNLLELALAPKAYPTYPMVLPDLEDFSSMESEKDTSPRKKSK